MASKTFARIQDNAVAELFVTDAEISSLFAPALVWVDVTGVPEVAQGWLYDGATFTAPPPLPAPPAPSLADLQAQLQALAAQIAALSNA